MIVNMGADYDIDIIAYHAATSCIHNKNVHILGAVVFLSRLHSHHQLLDVTPQLLPMKRTIRVLKNLTNVYSGTLSLADELHIHRR